MYLFCRKFRFEKWIAGNKDKNRKNNVIYEECNGNGRCKGKKYTSVKGINPTYTLHFSD